MSIRPTTVKVSFILRFFNAVIITCYQGYPNLNETMQILLLIPLSRVLKVPTTHKKMTKDIGRQVVTPFQAAQLFVVSSERHLNKLIPVRKFLIFVLIVCMYEKEPYTTQYCTHISVQ